MPQQVGPVPPKPPRAPTTTTHRACVVLSACVAGGCIAPVEFPGDMSRVVILRQADTDGPASLTLPGSAPVVTRGQFVFAELPMASESLVLPLGVASLELPDALELTGRPLPMPVALYGDLAQGALPAPPAWVEALRLPPFSSAACYARGGCPMLVGSVSRDPLEAETPVCQRPCPEATAPEVPEVDELTPARPEAPSALDCGTLRVPELIRVAGAPLARCRAAERVDTGPCPPGARRLANADGRCAVAVTCQERDWPDVPEDAATAWVDPTAPALGDGSRARPHNELRAALDRAEILRVAVRGTFGPPEPIRVPRSVEIVAACSAAARFEASVLVEAERVTLRGLGLVGSIEVAAGAGLTVAESNWVATGPAALTVQLGATATLAASRVTLSASTSFLSTRAGASVCVADAEVRGPVGATMGTALGDSRLRRTVIDGPDGLRGSTGARVELDDVEWRAAEGRALELSGAELRATRLQLTGEAREPTRADPSLIHLVGGSAALVDVALRAPSRPALVVRGGTLELRDAWVGTSSAAAVEAEGATVTIERSDLHGAGAAALVARGSDLSFGDLLFSRADEADDEESAVDRAGVIEVEGGRLRASRTAAIGGRHHTWSLRDLTEAELIDLLVEDRRGTRSLQVGDRPPALIWVDASGATRLVILRALVLGGFDGLGIHAQAGSATLRDVEVGPSAIDGESNDDTALRARGVRVDANRLEIDRLTVHGRPEFGLSARLFGPSAAASFGRLLIHDLRASEDSRFPCDVPEPSNAVDLTFFDPSVSFEGHDWRVERADGRGVALRGAAAARVRGLILQDVRCRALEVRDQAQLSAEDILVRRREVGREGGGDEVLNAVNGAGLLARRVTAEASGATALARFTDLAEIVVEDFVGDVPIGLKDDADTQLPRPLPLRALRRGVLLNTSVGLTFKEPPSAETCARFERRPVLQGVRLTPGARPIVGCEGR